MMKSVMIIGGYGEVGSHIAKQLTRLTEYRIFIAGRRLDRAIALCETLGSHATPVELDIKKSTTYASIKQVDLVVMCMDQYTIDVVRYCIEHYVHYVDITANYDFHKQIEQLKDKLGHSSVVLSVGFASGLSNLLAKELYKQDYSLDKLNITILLGLGEKHGIGAIQWLLDQLNQTYSIRRKSTLKTVRNFTKKRQVYFGRLGKRSGYRFNFSDQHVL